MAAIAAARHGLDVVLVDRADFPRHKVCGDCINPSAWPLLDQFSLVEKLRQLPHSIARRVEFHATGSTRKSIALPHSAQPEIVVQRRDLDAMLLNEARRCGTKILTGCPVETVAKSGDIWRAHTPRGKMEARCLIAADGRNSPVARILKLLPPVKRGRIGWQTHTMLPGEFQDTIAMFFLRHGYGGLADCGADTANLCVVSTVESASSLRQEACTFLGVEPGDWQSMSPIHRPPARKIAAEGLFLAGDAARVVEPFTGEGIYYAMSTGSLAGDAAARHVRSPHSNADCWFIRRHSAIYRGRMWINQLSRLAGSNPDLTAKFLRLTRCPAWLLGLLTRKVMSSL